ncbi:9365_t:CDS:2 [Diversispora eburnea]|uniref:9365_t:CDS:1 n=1 Tax=Diversispora eburnea TaxID=1213867 RepID=A0A9N8WR06_9GLOM|nr:9365_t:CDS:2 [Diversispora eburnea]
MEEEDKINFPIYLDEKRKVVPLYVHPDKYVSTNLLSDSLTQNKKVGRWKRRDIEILLDYIEANMEQWLYYKYGLYRFLNKHVFPCRSIHEIDRNIEVRDIEIIDDDDDNIEDRKSGKDFNNESSLSDEDEFTPQKRYQPIRFSNNRWWTVEEMITLLEFLEENVDSFLENKKLFWSWMSYNILKTRKPSHIENRYYYLSPNNQYKKKRMNHPQELHNQINNRVYIDPIQIQSNREFGKRLLKYSKGEDEELLSNCFGNSNKIGWPENLKEISK